jgi:hypothetical protein
MEQLQRTAHYIYLYRKTILSNPVVQAVPQPLLALPLM